VEKWRAKAEEMVGAIETQYTDYMKVEEIGH